MSVVIMVAVLSPAVVLTWMAWFSDRTWPPVTTAVGMGGLLVFVLGVVLLLSGQKLL